ncbi:MAG: hypothetical protein VR75_17915 [Hyphomonadaceae bacterium BRH_c29]|nr:MAG: hypothetical protein VR75_17915 [Hyphomonadaceae bacterium BRH_c29]
MDFEKVFNQKALKDIETFKATIAPWSHAYRRVVVALVAFREADSWKLYAGRVALGPLSVESKTFATDRILAVRLQLDLDEGNLSGFIDTILAGKIQLPSATVEFDPPQAGNRVFSTQVAPYDSGPFAQARTSVLRVFGKKFDDLQNKDVLDLHLMAATQPYGSFSELLSDFGVSDLGGLGGYLEVVGNVSVIVDLDRSTLSSGNASIILKGLPDLDSSKVRVGFQVFSNGKVQRMAMKGEHFRWIKEEDFIFGGLSLSFSGAGALRLFVSYDDHILHHCWLSDPDQSPNARRNIHNSFDPNFEVLSDALLKQPDRRQDAREFETAVGWLFWILGFSPIAWSGSRRLTDAPDLAVQSADGRILVIEATTGTLRVENKLPNLVERTQRIRSALASQGAQYTIVPVLCTSLSGEAIAADTDHAANLGVVVLNEYHIKNLLDRTITPANSDVVVSEFLSALESRRALLAGGIS